MFFYTHLVIGLFFSLVFMNYFESKFIFIFIVLVSSVLPDIDTRFSKIGKNKVFRPLQFFVKHRGIFHSFIFLILFSLLLGIFSRTLLFGFLIGYGSHLIIDKIGIKTGSLFETLIFVLFLVFNLVLIGFRVIELL